MKINKNINYYSVLDLTHTYTKSDIKRSFRALSKIHHPDKNGGDSEHFKLISESYRVLTTPDLKSKYDKESKYGVNYDPFIEILESNLSSDNTGGRVHQQMKKYKQNEMLHIVLELSDFTDTITYTRNIVCSKCDGSSNLSVGSLNLVGKMGRLFEDEEMSCDICNGSGTFQSRECIGCKGEGYIKLGLSKCDKCDGMGTLTINKTIKVKLEDFTDNKLKILYHGNQSKYTGSVGNLYIIIKEE